MKPEKGKKREKPLPALKKEGSSNGLTFISGLFFNIMGAGVAGVFLYVLFSNVQGYDWLLNTMLKNSNETIKNYPVLTIDQRYEMKSGEIGVVLKIKQLTPDSAIIIIPPRKNLADVKLTSAEELPWLTYFVYPRKVVYEDDKDSSKLYPQANYIMCLNGWGLNKLNYRVDRPEGLMILPLKR